MTVAFWQERWAAGSIAFHQKTVNRHLAMYAVRLGPTPSRVLVPLCGKSRDLSYLASLGHEVVGVEAVEQAAVAFFEEQGVTPTRGTTGKLPFLEAQGVRIIVADIFDVRPSLLGKVSSVYDRAALIALPPEVRADYAPHLIGLVERGGPMLVITIEYAASEMKGPPYSVAGAEIQSLFGGACALSRLEVIDALDESPHLKARGLTALTEEVWLLHRR